MSHPIRETEWRAEDAERLAQEVVALRKKLEAKEEEIRVLEELVHYRATMDSEIPDPCTVGGI